MQHWEPIVIFDDTENIKDTKDAGTTFGSKAVSIYTTDTAQAPLCICLHYLLAILLHDLQGQAF